MEHAYRMVVRTKKEDSAFLYHILEAQDGWCFCSTLDHRAGDPHRDVELLVPMALVKNVKELLADLGEMVEVLEG